jgi:hypothetical protein
VFTTALVLAATLFGAAPAQAASADLSVALDAVGAVLLPGARYDVMVTNHGPDALTSATVVVRLEHPTAPPSTAQPCVLDPTARTLTCAFGAVAAGQSVTLSGWVYYLINGAPRPVDATATRTASTPPDPNPGNDTATKHCWYNGSPGFPPSPWPPPLSC